MTTVINSLLYHVLLYVCETIKGTQVCIVTGPH
jgi:hypothetical protein